MTNRSPEPHTPLASRRARMRKPSCLISCSQWGRAAGSVLAGNGKQGSTRPTVRPLRCNIGAELNYSALRIQGIAYQRPQLKT
jgi:hypothetical protein